MWGIFAPLYRGVSISADVEDAGSTAADNNVGGVRGYFEAPDESVSQGLTLRNLRKVCETCRSFLSAKSF